MLMAAPRMILHRGTHLLVVVVVYLAFANAINLTHTISTQAGAAELGADGAVRLAGGVAIESASSVKVDIVALDAPAHREKLMRSQRDQHDASTASIASTARVATTAGSGDVAPLRTWRGLTQQALELNMVTLLLILGVGFVVGAVLAQTTQDVQKRIGESSRSLIEKVKVTMPQSMPKGLPEKARVLLGKVKVVRHQPVEVSAGNLLASLTGRDYSVQPENCSHEDGIEPFKSMNKEETYLICKHCGSQWKMMRGDLNSLVALGNARDAVGVN